MARDARFDAMTTRWSEAFEEARALCSYFAGLPTNHDHELLALAHKAMVDEEDPAEYLAAISRPFARPAMAGVGLA